MKKLAIMLSIIPLVASATENYYSYRITESSYITISGATNVNTFKCLWSGEIPQGSFVTSIDPIDGEIAFEDAELLIDIKGFKCENHIMSNDMRKAMGGDEHPDIIIKLHKVEAINDKQTSKNSGSHKVFVRITINGVQKQTSLVVNWNRPKNTYYTFKGSKSLNMTAFDIEPPKRLLEMIRVRSTINIEFNLFMHTN